MILKELALAVEKGNIKKTKELVQQALEEKVPPSDILNVGMIDALGIVGDKFRRNEIFVPEMLIAAKAMTAGTKILEPILAEAGVKSLGTVVIGTVRGDLHDIGKNLVKMMMKGVGLEVVDLGVDVPDAAFVEKAEEVGADIVCLSALLTTTMPAIKDVVNEFEKAGVKDKYKIMIGGAPVTADFAKQVNADLYAADATTAADVAREVILQKRAVEA